MNIKYLKVWNYAKKIWKFKKNRSEKKNAINFFKFYFSQFLNYKVFAFDKMISLTILFQYIMIGNEYLE